MSAPELSVLSAVLCREIKRSADGDPTAHDFIHESDVAELPKSGPLDLDGTTLALKICRTLVVGPAGIEVDSEPLSVALSITFHGPSVPMAPPQIRQLSFDKKNSMVKAAIPLAGLQATTKGIHAFVVSAGEHLLTVVPLLVVPHGLAKMLPATTFE